MSEISREDKVLAARKKLKEYQERKKQSSNAAAVSLSAASSCSVSVSTSALSCAAPPIQQPQPSPSRNICNAADLADSLFPDATNDFLAPEASATSSQHSNSTKSSIVGVSEQFRCESPLNQNTALSPQNIPLTTNTTSPATESILQISRHLNGLSSSSSHSSLAPTHSFSTSQQQNGGDLEQDETSTRSARGAGVLERTMESFNQRLVSELEKRNVELAGQLQQLSQNLRDRDTQLAQLRKSGAASPGVPGNSNNSGGEVDGVAATASNSGSTSSSSMRSERYDTLLRQLDAAREQLTSQGHTVGLLVAEKSELQSQLSHEQRRNEAQTQRAEDLAGRLRQTRDSGVELERELANQRLAHDQLEMRLRDSQTDCEQARVEAAKRRKQAEEAQALAGQLRQRVEQQNKAVAGLEAGKEELRKQLELAQVYQRQMNSSQLDRDRERSVEQRGLQQRVEELERENERITTELRHASGAVENTRAHWQEHVVQLERRLVESGQKLDSLRVENQALIGQVEDGRRRIDSLDLQNSQLVKQQQQQSAMSAANQQSQRDGQEVTLSSTSAAAAVEEAQNRIEELEKQLEQSELCHTAQLAALQEEQSARLAHKERELASASERIEEQESVLEQTRLRLADSESELQGSQDLLKQLQADQTALSMALAQNRQLKERLLELEQGFLRVSEDAMQSKSEVSEVQHKYDEVIRAHSQLDTEIASSRTLQQSKDAEIAQLTQRVTELNELIERERQSFEHRQLEVESANQMRISQLQHELQLVEAAAVTTACATQHVATQSEMTQSNQTQPQMTQLESIEQGEEAAEEDEREHMRREENAVELELVLEKWRAEARDLHAQCGELRNQLEKSEEERARQEHLVGQLEAETNAITDFILIYQRQRSLLHKRAIAWQRFVRHVITQRDRIRGHFVELQSLVTLHHNHHHPNQPTDQQEQQQQKGELDDVTNEQRKRQIIAQMEQVLGEASDFEEALHFVGHAENSDFLDDPNELEIGHHHTQHAAQHAELNQSDRTTRSAAFESLMARGEAKGGGSATSPTSSSPTHEQRRFRGPGSGFHGQLVQCKCCSGHAMII